MTNIYRVIVLILVNVICLHGCVVVSPELQTTDAGGDAKTMELVEINLDDHKQSSHSSKAVQPRGIIKEQVHNSILTFTDRYMERITQVSDEFITSEITPMDREYIQSMRVAYVTSAIAIATEAEPLNQLLDMYIMVSLQLSVWEDTKAPFLLKYKEKMTSTLGKLKASINKIAYHALSSEDIMLLDSMIDKWREDNPEQTYVAFVRFDDFHASVDKEKLLDSIEKKGIFASIRSAEQDLRDIENISERALFLANRFPILIRWQSELLFYRLASTNEFLNLQQDMNALSQSIENVSYTFASLPTEIEEQRAELIDELSLSIHERVGESLNQFDTILTAQRSALFTDLENNSDSLVQIFRELSISAQALQELSQSIERMSAGNESDSTELNLSEIQQIVIDSNQLAEKLHTMLEFIADNEFVNEDGIQKTGKVLEDLLFRVFILAASLIILTVLLVTVSVLYVKRKTP